jgi:hypothetical protein
METVKYKVFALKFKFKCVSKWELLHWNDQIIEVPNESSKIPCQSQCTLHLLCKDLMLFVAVYLRVSLCEQQRPNRKYQEFRLRLRCCQICALLWCYAASSGNSTLHNTPEEHRSRGNDQFVSCDHNYFLSFTLHPATEISNRIRCVCQSHGKPVCRWTFRSRLTFIETFLTLNDAINTQNIELSPW